MPDQWVAAHGPAGETAPPIARLNVTDRSPRSATATMEGKFHWLLSFTLTQGLPCRICNTMAMIYDRKSMSARLQTALDENRQSMRSVSLDSGLSDTAVHGIIKLGRDPRVGSLASICDTIGVSVAYLMYGVEAPKEDEACAETKEILDLLHQNPSKRKAILSLLRG